jgi:hypothetical protein
MHVLFKNPNGDMQVSQELPLFAAQVAQFEAKQVAQIFVPPTENCPV